MSEISPVWTMIGLDILMIVYTMWVISLSKPLAYKVFTVGIPMLVWLGVLHVALSNQILSPQDISGIVFLVVILVALSPVSSRHTTKEHNHDN